MRPDRPLIIAVASLATGVGLIVGYCQDKTTMNFAYPFSGSALHLDLATYGPAALGGFALSAFGVLLLVWSFFAAIVHQINLLSGSDDQAYYLNLDRERVEPFKDEHQHDEREHYPGSLGLGESRHEG